ncbi:SurA N-terminal domain-containing protein [Sphingomonas sp. LB-2]|uniref:peptidylprolyl isomerase n=1 Tax=Sphingomonas caeni TaxID=2984949 RepID=UPI00223265DE|nr:peptidylprolyl isomerase [Sphingomonas caeni]MCW3849262.1 SurA N-terminal domain-containing protein [Sphingomonas caeni]
MLDAFRNFTKSLFGKIVVLIVLGVIAIAFAAGDVTGLRGSGAGKSATLATVGDYTITEAEVTTRLQDLLRQQNNGGGPQMTMENLLQRGGFEYVMNELLAVHAVEEFAKQNGMIVDQAMIDSDIANNPRFIGIDGKFDQKRFDAELQQTNRSARQWRDDIATERYIRWLLPNPQIRTPVADGLAAPYASLILERRTGLVTLIRPQDMDAGAEPDDKMLTAFYTRNKARYQIPPRRIMRYAIVHPDQFKAQSAATDAEIQQAFAASGGRYAATEKRTVRQIVLPDQAAANAVAAELRGGKSAEAAAKGRGLEATNFDGVEKAKLSAQTSPAIADAAFGVTAAGVVGPVKTPLGWAVLKVESIQKIAARTLDQVRSELADEISQRKTAQAMVTLRQALEDDIGNGGTFDEVTAKGKLTVQRTPALTAEGIDPDHPPQGKDAKPDATLAMLAAAGFQFDPDSQEPLLIPTDKDGSFAVIILDKAIAATPRPLESIRPQVLADYRLDQQLFKARKAAQDLRAEINKGTPMREALAKLGIRALPPKEFSLVRGDLKPTDAAQVRMAFSMAPHSAKFVEGASREGYYVVYVDTVQDTDGKGNAAAMERARAEFLPGVRQELAEQFVEAIKRHVVVKRNEANITALRARLGRSGAASQ